ncbi:FadR/GntR family transcriptional regulator [Actinacidiphila sp. ITFR-21]|uniref:FadR/GntR family transcriptional regulator n=1 Tax=Actinacidiphila sp. ITFR-21 TaxID=3075199 RepID=UPI002889A7BF|nr:GntR family transcriptional regulator [Streptomyces sp. ITFR-21]WNI18757.1 GntR family transcriptional regulator [Streptomyces sp. ITFR-21]
MTSDESLPSAPTDLTSARTGFTRVKARRGFQEIVNQVRAEIAAGNLRPGDKLPNERDMAQIFGVARQSVREATRVLEQAGLVTVSTGVTGGVFIAKGDTSVVTRGIHDLAFFGQLSPASLLETRILITSEAVRLACERGTERDFEELDADIDETETLTAPADMERRAKQIVNFYRILGRSTHNEVYALLIDALTDIVAARLAVVGHGPQHSVVATRRRILELIRERDAEGAIEELVAHLERLEAYMSEQERDQKRDRPRSASPLAAG